MDFTCPGQKIPTLMYPHIQQFASWLSQFKRNSPLRSHSVVEASICGRLCTHSGTNSPHIRLFPLNCCQPTCKLLYSYYRYPVTTHVPRLLCRGSFTKSLGWGPALNWLLPQP